MCFVRYFEYNYQILISQSKLTNTIQFPNQIIFTYLTYQCITISQIKSCTLPKYIRSIRLWPKTQKSDSSIAIWSIWFSDDKGSDTFRLSYLGAMSDPCCTKAPQLCQKQLCKVRVFCKSLFSLVHGSGSTHSSGVNLKMMLRSQKYYNVDKVFESDILPSVCKDLMN